METSTPTRSRAVHPAPAWVAPFVGIPFAPGGRTKEGADCWGLVRLVAGEHFGLQLPSYAGLTWEEGADERSLSAFLAAEAQQDCWLQIGPGEEDGGDFLLMRGGKYMRHNLHVGLIVSYGWVLHTEEGVASGLMKYSDITIKNRISGFYRHVSRTIG